jgi:hypothetical protein
VVLSIQYTIGLRARIAPLVPSGCADHGVEVATNVCDTRKTVPRTSEADVGETPRSWSRLQCTLVKDKSSGGGVGRAFGRSDADTVLVRRYCGSQEVRRPATVDKVHVAFNVCLEGEEVSRDAECVLISVDLTAKQRSVLTALNGESKRGDILLRSKVVSEVDIERMEVVTLGIHSRAICVATFGSLSVNATAELDRDLILREVVGRSRIALENGVA